MLMQIVRHNSNQVFLLLWKVKHASNCSTEWSQLSIFPIQKVTLVCGLCAQPRAEGIINRGEGKRHNRRTRSNESRVHEAKRTTWENSDSERLVTTLCQRTGAPVCRNMCLGQWECQPVNCNAGDNKLYLHANEGKGESWQVTRT